MSVTAGERRIVSVLVADIAGSTPIAEKLGPERYKFLFDEVARLMREEVERFDGTVAQLTGDGLLALFGAPAAHEDDSERAVRTALAIRQAIDRYGDEVGPTYGIDLAARVAVNTGPVVIPASDAPPHELYNALGETVTIAARLQPLGDLIVGPATAHQIEDLFELDPLGEVELKGKSERVTAYRVVGMIEHPAARIDVPLVGRADELEAVCGALEAVAGGDGAIVSISGEPGIGKSRIVAEATSRFADRGRIVKGHCVPYAESIPYWPVRDLVRDWLGLGVSDPEARARLELRTQLTAALGDDAGEAYPYLAGLLGLTLEQEQEEQIRVFAPDAVQRQTVDWMFQLVTAIAHERPLCVVFEDLHWSDDATRSLLDELLSAVEQVPIAFVLVHRSDPDHPAWQIVDRARRRYGDLFREVTLQALSDEQAEELAAADAGGKLPPELMELLAERAGGNPYFVGEAIRDLRERGALKRENGRLTLVGSLSVPAAIQEALQARLDRLDPEARELITTAAVIGHSFGLPLLERVLPHSRLRSTLSELQWLQLVVEERSGAAPEYRFRHGLVQEVAYGTLVETRRRELHGIVGRALEDLHRDSPDEVWGLLAHHFAEADDAGRAVDYLLKAGDAARAVYAQDEAIELYQRALGFMERTGDTVRARSTLLRMALTHHLASNYPAANRALARAFDLPAPEVERLEPDEHIEWATTSGWPVERVAPGHCGSSELSSWVTCNLFRGLVTIGRDLEIEADLAERFEVSDDGRRYLFALRRNARWSDGVPLSARDFAVTFTRMVEDGIESAAWLEGVQAKALDEHVLELRLDEPRSHLLFLLGQPLLFAWPAHVYERDGPDWYRRVPLVGSGPFVLVDRAAPSDARERGQVILEHAPAWYGSRGNVGEVRVQLEAPPEDAGRRWQQGDYDLIYEFLAELAKLTIDESTVVQRDPGGLADYLGLVATRAPLDDARVRRALAHAVNRESLTRAVGGIPASTGGMVPPSVPGHSHRVAPPYDPDRARALLAETGHADGRGLEEVVLAHFGVQEELALELSEQLGAVGFRVRRLPCYSTVSLQQAIETTASLFSWSYGYDYPDPVGVLAPLLDWGTWFYRDEELEGLLRRASAATDPDERIAAIREFERIWIGEQAAAVPLSYNDRLLWRRPWVTGLWANGLAKATFAEAVVRR